MVDAARTGTGGVRVVEYAGAGSGIAAAYAGWLMARMGAQVIRLQAASDSSNSADRSDKSDWFHNSDRSDGSVAVGVGQPPDASPVALALQALSQGKTSEAMPREPAALDARLADCDVLLCDAPRSLAQSAGSATEIAGRMPRLVVGIATAFGLDGPYAGYPGTGLDAQALSGAAWALGEPGREPLTLPPGIVEHQAGAMLAAGCLLALAVRDARGTGRVVDIALAEVLASHVAGNCRFYIHHGLHWHRSGRRASGSGGAYPFAILPCKDGEVCITGRTRDEWMRLVRAMGNPGWAALPRYQDLRAMGRQYPDEVDALMAPWLAQHTMAELERIALENNLIVSPIRAFAEVVRTRHFVDDGFLEPGRIAGKDVLLPSLPFKVTETRDEAAADIAGSLLATVRADGPAQAAACPSVAAARAPVAQGDAVRPPLAGLRVLDMGWVWSAPWVGTMLAELGAQVIKVEHSMRPDNLRLAGKVFRDGQKVDGPSTEMSPMFHQINHNKLGITLNAKEPRAVDAITRLAAISDVVIENMSPGSMERQRLGYDALREVNPRLVMLSMSSVGQFGELSGMRAYAPTMSSFAGMEALVGYRGEPPIGALNFALADPNASVHALVALLAALRRAQATGQGCLVDVAQVEALLGTLRPYLLDAQVSGRQPETIGNANPAIAPHGIYPALETDAWLTIAVADDVQWQALAELARGEAWAADPRLRDRSGRIARAHELDRMLAGWTRRRPRDSLVAMLREAGIAATPVLTVEQAWRDPHFGARHMMHRVEIPFYGEAELCRAPWRFSDFEPRVERSGPRLGEHNDYVFGELLGMPPAEIAELKAAGVIA